MYIKVDFKSALLNVVPPPGKLEENTNEEGIVSFKKRLNYLDNTGNNFIGYGTRKDCELISTVNSGNPMGDVFNPIHKEQVSNMLHVLLGERPVSTFHTPIFNGTPIRKRIRAIDEIAENGYYKIDNDYIYEDSGKKMAYCEFVIGKKNATSNDKNATAITFIKLKDYFKVKGCIEKYDLFLNILSKYTNKPVNEKNYATITEAYLDLYPNENAPTLEVAYNKYGKDKTTKLCSFINDLATNGGFNMDLVNGTFRRPTGKDKLFIMKSTNNHIRHVVDLYGSFIFNVDEETAKRILNGKRGASFLDGGLAKITKWNDTLGFDSYIIDDLSEYDIEKMGYKKII